MAAFDWHGGKIRRRTPITPDYRNTQNVRRFFRRNVATVQVRPFMAWVTAASGKTMGDAADEWLLRKARR